MKDGELVPDQVMMEMVANRLSLADLVQGFILDSFPRTVVKLNGSMKIP